MKRFRISKNDTIRARLLNDSGELLAILYDSGFTSLNQVRSTLISKVANVPRKTYFSVYNEDKDIYWSNK